jgi:hypothetical protein
MGILPTDAHNSMPNQYLPAADLSLRRDLGLALHGHALALGCLAYDVPFDRALLAALWEAPLDQVDNLAPLRLLSLAQADPIGYGQHPLPHAYCRGLLHAAGEADPVPARYASVFANILDSARPVSGRCQH